MCSLSIVIPCYNGWKLMTRCLEAFENQTVAPDEIIFIDDNSNDESYESLLKYANASRLNIIVLQNEINRGPGYSRKIGISVASSEYVAFCDCDDWVERDFVKNIKDIISKKNIELLIYDSYTAYENGTRRKANATAHLIGANKKEILANYAMSLCRMAVKKEICVNLEHTDLRHAEDGVVVVQLIKNAKAMFILDEPLYNYFFRKDSVSKKPSSNTYLDLIEAFSIICKSIKELYPEECEFIGIKYVCYGSVLNAYKANVPRKKIEDEIEKFERLFPEWYNNKYMKNLGKAKRFFLWLIYKKIYFLLAIVVKLHPLFT